MMKSKKQNSSIDTTKMDELISTYKQEVPPFYEDGVCEIIHVPVKGGTIKVYHHKPKNPIAKRPIIFSPGFATIAEIWGDFHISHHGKAEYYHIESREKKSAKIERNRKTDLSMEQLARDVAKVIEFVGLKEKDYVLIANCLGGGVMLLGLIEKYLNPPTIIVIDPFTKWTQNRLIVKIIMPILPPFMLGLLKTILGKLFLANMKNKAQKKRNEKMIKLAVAWKWRKFSITNVNYDLTDKFDKITQEVFVFHGPPDKYHPEGSFKKVAKAIPNGRFFYMRTRDELRELLSGAIAAEFSMVTKDEGVPEKLKQFEVDLGK